MNAETEQAIAEAVRAELATTPAYRFELVYVDYSDGFSQEQVDALARGDWETLDESVDEWICDSQFESSRELLEEILRHLEDEDDGWHHSTLAEWMATDEAIELQHEIMERDTSIPLKDLARQSGNVLLRVRARDGYVIEEAEDEIHYWISAVNVIDLYDIWTGTAERVRLTKAYPWRGDVWNGGGMVDDDNPVEIEVARADLRTDHDASGYSWTEVAGPIVSYYESKIEPITEEVNA